MIPKFKKFEKKVEKRELGSFKCPCSIEIMRKIQGFHIIFTKSTTSINNITNITFLKSALSMYLVA